MVISVDSKEQQTSMKTNQTHALVISAFLFFSTGFVFAGGQVYGYVENYDGQFQETTNDAVGNWNVPFVSANASSVGGTNRVDYTIEAEAQYGTAQVFAEWSETLTIIGGAATNDHAIFRFAGHTAGNHVSGETSAHASIFGNGAPYVDGIVFLQEGDAGSNYFFNLNPRIVYGKAFELKSVANLSYGSQPNHEELDCHLVEVILPAGARFAPADEASLRARNVKITYPRLSISFSGNNVTLRWAGTAQSVIESTTNIGDAAGWCEFGCGEGTTEGIAASTTQWQLTRPVDTAMRFFRIKQS